MEEVELKPNFYRKELYITEGLGVQFATVGYIMDNGTRKNPNGKPVDFSSRKYLFAREIDNRQLRARRERFMVKNLENPFAYRNAYGRFQIIYKASDMDCSEAEKLLLQAAWGAHKEKTRKLKREGNMIDNALHPIPNDDPEVEYKWTLGIGFANAKLEDIIELPESMPEHQVEECIYDMICERLDWGYERVE